VKDCSVLCSYANSESYRRALEDFDAALAVNPDHTNARKYTCDTLLALARRCVVNDLQVKGSLLCLIRANVDRKLSVC